jgi:hypothetical protein
VRVPANSSHEPTLAPGPSLSAASRRQCGSAASGRWIAPALHQVSPSATAR